LLEAPLDLALGGVIIFVAYLVRGITGFGSGLIAIPLLTLMYPLTTVVPVVVCLDVIGSTAQAVANRRNVEWKILLPLFPVTLLGIAGAWFFFRYVDTSTLSLLLGIFIIFFAVYQVLPAPALKGGPVMALPFGVLGGLLGTLFGTGGPAYVIYFNLRGLSKSEFRASYAVYFMIDGAVRLAVYILALGLISAELAFLLVCSLVPFALGLFAGGKVHSDISPETFKRLISLVLLLSGVALILRH